MSRIVRKGEAPFSPRARILKLVGGELIRDDVMAVAELIKNSHDADARVVTLSFDDTTTDEGVITVRDDGFGMNLEELLNHWLQPAGSSKRTLSNKRTPLGRRVLGEKGVGRFAVDRLGRRCELISRKVGSPNEIIANIDWDAFDDDSALLSDILIDWEEREAVEFHTQGTLLRISGLRQRWNNRLFSRLTARLRRLSSPYSSDDSFSIHIEANDLPDYSGGIASSFMDAAPYRFDACFDGAGTISLNFNGAKRVIQWPGPGALTCGKLSMKLSVFDLESEALKNVGPFYDVRAWLREWSGIGIYRDGFRVLPYGEPDDDWLRLDQRRVNNPVTRLSNNQVCGMLEISADTNPDLRDQTNRGGLIQNQQFEDLRRLTLFVLEQAEAERSRIRHPETQLTIDLKDNDNEKVSVDALLSLLRQHVRPISKAVGFSLLPVLEQLKNARQQEIAVQEKLVGLHSEVSAVGHNAGLAIMSLQPLLNQVHETLKAVENNDSIRGSDLRDLQKIALKMQGGLDLMMPMATVVSESRRGLDLTAELQNFNRMAEPVLTVSQLAIDNDFPDELLLINGRRDYLLQMLFILLRNAMQAIGVSEDRRLRLKINKAPDDRKVSILFMDRGHGIPSGVEDSIFELGFSTRRGARGLGLSIARTLVKNFVGGEIKVSREYEPEGWTAMQINFNLSPD